MKDRNSTREESMSSMKAMYEAYSGSTYSNKAYKSMHET